MEIKIEKINKTIKDLDKLIDDYELTYINLYGIMNNMSFSWNDNKAKVFFEDVDKEKDKVIDTVSDINNVINIYKYLLSKYEVLGKKIKFELTNKDNVFKKIDECLIRVEDIINKYNNLNLSNCPDIIDYINNELVIIKNNKVKLLNYKTKLKDTISYIDEVEKNINQKLSGITIEKIKEQDIEEFI